MSKIVFVALLPFCIYVAYLGFSSRDEAEALVVEGARLGNEGERLTLLSEVTDAELAVLTGEASAELDPEEPDVSVSPEYLDASLEEVKLSPVELGCVFIGELSDADDALKLERFVRARGAEVIGMTRIVEELGSYFVYVDPLPTQAEAISVINSLRDVGIDSIITRGGENENGVSLGVFRSEENSAALAARVRDLGVDARRRRLSVESELYSVLVGGSVVPDIEEEFWDEIRSNYPGISVEKKACDEVASDTNFQ